MKEDRVYLLHVRDALRRIVEYTKGGEEVFLSDPKTQDAVIRNLEVIGEAGHVKRGSPAAVLQGRIEFVSRATLILTFGGGTNEIQRDIIAMAGLGMPRSLRG